MCALRRVMERGRGLPHTHSPLVRGRPGRVTLSQHRAAAEGSGQGRSCCPQWARPRPARLGTDRSSRSAMQFSRVHLSICLLNCRPELNSSPLGGLGGGELHAPQRPRNRAPGLRAALAPSSPLIQTAQGRSRQRGLTCTSCSVLRAAWLRLSAASSANRPFGSLRGGFRALGGRGLV